MPGLTIQGLRQRREDLRKEAAARQAGLKGRIAVHMGTCGNAAGARGVRTAIVEELNQRGIRDVMLIETGCGGLCSREPMITVELGNSPAVKYGDLTAEKARKIVADHIVAGNIVEQYTVAKGPNGAADIPFFKKQAPLVLRNCGVLDPEKIEDYISSGGYAALAMVLTSLTPEEVIDEVTRAGLRGRGGAGFPTGVKWKVCRGEERSPKYIVGNCDEGDPGAYMDRSLLESDPHSIVEGMTIAAYAIGARRGYVYVRSEYPLAIERLRRAIQQARLHSLVGDRILGCDFDFDMEIREGSGAFVCGEETSLLHSIEGQNPEPRQRPPFPAQVGLWGCPTVINNVETLANIPVIVTRGADWYSTIGTPASKGTKIFSLVGKINNTGLIEVPMGITLREVVYEIGGGIPDNKEFKAVQTGGPSGGCVPASLIDLPLDYESLKQAGAMMGSGGMIVMDEDTCMVDVSKFFVQFTNDESCGKCSACRDGSEALLEVLTRITDGQAKEGDVEFLEELGSAVKDASMCGLGQTLPNPVLSTLRYFRDEYIAHVADRNCPGKVCRALIKYYIDPDKCPGCAMCLKSCPAGAIQGATKHIHIIDQAICTKCGECLEICPPKVSAVVKLSGKQAREMRSLDAPIPVSEWKKQRAAQAGTGAVQ